MKIDKAIADVRDAEERLGKELRAVGERHAAERDVYNMARTLANQCGDQLRKLAPVATRYGVPGSESSVPDAPSLLETVRYKGSELLGRSEVSLMLLSDLRKLYVAAQEAELDWVILGQVAQAVRDPDLLDVVSTCLEPAEARGKWLRARIKESAPQVLATG